MTPGSGAGWVGGAHWDEGPRREAALSEASAVSEPVTGNEQLARLHEAYVWQVNAAVAEGRMDLVEELVNQYTEEALELMTAEALPEQDRR